MEWNQVARVNLKVIGIKTRTNLNDVLGERNRLFVVMQVHYMCCACCNIMNLFKITLLQVLRERNQNKPYVKTCIK